MTRHEVQINLDQIANFAHVGVRRAAIFMGLGHNAAAKVDFNDYELSKLTIDPALNFMPVNFVPTNASLEDIQGYKREFASWVTACGLREVIEYYALMLNHIHRYALVVTQTQGVALKNPEKLHRDFHGKAGLKTKLDFLRERFEVGPQYPDFIASIYLARNALTHNQAIVTEKNSNTNGALIVQWVGMELFLRGDETGEDRPLQSMMNVRLEEQSRVILKYPRREKIFPIGSKLEFGVHELWEICGFFSMNCIPTIIRSFSDFLNKHNIPRI